MQAGRSDAEDFFDYVVHSCVHGRCMEWNALCFICAWIASPSIAWPINLHRCTCKLANV